MKVIMFDCCDERKVDMCLCWLSTHVYKPSLIFILFINKGWVKVFLNETGTFDRIDFNILGLAPMDTDPSGTLILVKTQYKNIIPFIEKGDSPFQNIIPLFNPAH